MRYRNVRKHEQTSKTSQIFAEQAEKEISVTQHLENNIANAPQLEEKILNAPQSWSLPQSRGKAEERNSASVTNYRLANVYADRSTALHDLI
ncbi:hypothetical protein KIN20_020349 [Parelaphostrongylus tenuis]|uniref:Uncharacterized protein n=1 Tax=Parelaphostrongylus tenuis TaxID=148309 RepID=A0AAD5MMG6_PARTN|nr:hypothetical protein KIN20_020349 [Parelaphostrongylus tenuis]